MTPLELALVLASAGLHASWSVAIKGSGDPLCFSLLQSWASFAALAAVLPWLDLAEIPRVVWWLLAATGVVHAAYLYWMSRAYEHGDLSLVYPIARSTPAFLPLVAVPLLGETLRPAGAAGIAVVVAGLWLVHGRDFRLAQLAEPAARFALLTLAATVGYALVDKVAMARLADAPWESPIPRAVAYGLLLAVAHALCFAPLVLARRGARAVAATARSHFGRATLAWLQSFASYTLILAALQTALVSYVVAVRQSSVLFAVALGALVLRERPGRDRIIGAVFTVAGVALIALFG